MQRVRDAQTTVNLDYIEVFAKVFQKEPWQLLHPKLGESSAQPSAPTLAQALEVVAGALNQLPDDRRELVAQHLQTLARAPDSQRAMESLLASMQHVAGPMPTAESRDFQPPVPSGLFDKTKQPS